MVLSSTVNIETFTPFMKVFNTSQPFDNIISVVRAADERTDRQHEQSKAARRMVKIKTTENGLFEISHTVILWKKRQPRKNIARERLLKKPASSRRQIGVNGGDVCEQFDPLNFLALQILLHVFIQELVQGFDAVHALQLRYMDAMDCG